MDGLELDIADVAKKRRLTAAAAHRAATRIEIERAFANTTDALMRRTPRATRFSVSRVSSPRCGAACPSRFPRSMRVTSACIKPARTPIAPYDACGY